jgi:hypothetical protein
MKLPVFTTPLSLIVQSLLAPVYALQSSVTSCNYSGFFKNRPLINSEPVFNCRDIEYLKSKAIFAGAFTTLLLRNPYLRRSLCSIADKQFHTHGTHLSYLIKLLTYTYLDYVIINKKLPV